MIIVCPHCQQQYEVEENVCGKVQCTQCMKEFEIQSYQNQKASHMNTFNNKSEDNTKTGEIKQDTYPGHNMPIFNQPSRKQLDCNLTLPHFFYFLGVCSIIFTIYLLSNLKVKSAIHEILVVCTTTCGLISSILFIGLGRIIKSGIIRETYIQNLYFRITNKDR